ncbi:MAG: hypothetical protein KC729_04245 [Candidatus Eisenbacteria bacterium]|uniref:Uncharacterized protein n=1 Tax=Eiseniibacteriota bacterium TaxID=2212470 RepID=A0A956LW99_UNCEI|nr:hypothetical protein [Candidatus Eisenbacteria bacterium]
MSDVESEVDLTPEQAAEVQAALEEWRQLAAASDVMEDVLLEDSPAVTFLGRVANQLSAQQMEHLRRLVGEAVAARAGGLVADPTDRGPTFHGGIRGLFKDLDLTEEQVIAIRDALEQSRETVQDLCAQYRAGEITEDELREGRAQARADLAAAINAVLTEDQQAQLEQNKLDILVRRLNALLLRYDVRIGHRVDRLDILLDLSDAQAAAITDILMSEKTDLESLRDAVAAGNLSSAEAWDSFRALQIETNEAVRGELTEDQLTILDELRQMHEPCVMGVEL